MGGEESFRSFPGSIASTSDLSSSSSSLPSDHYYDATDSRRPLCEYEEFSTFSWRSASSWTTDESGSLSRVPSIGPQASAHADALRKELRELEEIRQEVLRKLSRRGLPSHEKRRKEPWLRLVDDTVSNLQERRSSGLLLLSWWQNRKLRESITALGSGGKALLEDLRHALVGREHELLQIERSIGAEGSDNIICIKGRKGIGKTRILQEFLKERSGELRFDAVIWLTISLGMPTSRIQKGIAKQMGISLAGHKGEEERRTALHVALSGWRFLLVLDDLQDALSLEAIGIPRPGSGSPSRIVITSRSEEVCGDMGAEVVIDVPALPERQSWELFRNVVGEAALRDPEAEEMARGLVWRCSDVPSVLVGLAEAMTDVRSTDEWRRYRNHPYLLRKLWVRKHKSAPADQGAVLHGGGMVDAGGGLFYLWEDVDPKYRYLYWQPYTDVSEFNFSSI